MTHISARELIESTLEPGSFEAWNTGGVEPAGETAYDRELAAARERTGLSESVISGAGTIQGRRVAVIVGEFSFLGGSIGVQTARDIVAALTRATAERIPVLAAPVSGGTRMQEGTAAFVHMVAISAAVVAHKDAGLPYLVYLRNPTTGGVFASWGSLGHVTVVEPGALIGFLGPRVYEALHGEPFPEGVQTAENLYRLGIVDAVVGHKHLAALVTSVLDVLAPPHPVPLPEEVSVGDEVPAEIDDWAAVELSRLSSRPGLRTLLRVGSDRVVALSGSGTGGDFGDGDRGLSICLARIAGRGVVVVGHDRRAQGQEIAIGPGALRAARRGFQLAVELGLPIVTVIDTPGVALSREAEEGGLAGEIARCLAALVAVPVPTVSVLLGQGAGGGALALVPADRVLVAQNGWLAPLPPEGASAIIHRDAGHAPDLARAQRVASVHLLQDGIADRVIPERPSADHEPEAFARRVVAAIASALDDLAPVDPTARLVDRTRRYERVNPVRTPPKEHP